MKGRVLDRPSDLTDTARLLFDVFGAPQFRDSKYLDWFYRQGPLGPAIEVDFADERGLLGHIAGVVHVYHSRSGEHPTMFPLNVAVHERGRGQGVMAKMTAALYAAAEQRWNKALLTGMPNENSTEYYVTKGGYRLLGNLPVKICPSVWPQRSPVETRRIDSDYLYGREFEDLFETLDLAPQDGWCEKYTLPVLRWRLSRPGSDYRIHSREDAVVVTASERRKGVGFTVVMKTFRRHGAARERVDVTGVVAAACRQRGTPLAVYAGFSSQTIVRGVRLPDRLKPSPLNTVVNCRPAGSIDLSGFEYSTFEFLEFDAC